MRHRRLLARLVYVLYLVVILEVASRAFVAIEWNTHFFRPSDVLHSYYPGLRKPATIEIAPGDGYFDILVLGASVLNQRWGNIEGRLWAGFSEARGRSVRVHNLARHAQTTRDSYYKYLNLADKRFDLVILYHGINDVRANNAPPEVFREDYSHYHWYGEINRIHAHGEIDVLTLPFVLAHAASRAREMLGLASHVPKNIPREDWVEHGSEIKTVPSFRRNVSRIIELARDRQDLLVLMTFAFHVPRGGWPDDLELQRSPWGREKLPAWLWGKEQNVVAGIEAHNEVIRALAAENPSVLFVDQQAMIPHDEDHFTDVCHFTWLGCRAFADNLLQVAEIGR